MAPVSLLASHYRHQAPAAPPASIPAQAVEIEDAGNRVTPMLWIVSAGKTAHPREPKRCSIAGNQQPLHRPIPPARAEARASGASGIRLGAARR